MSIIDIKAPGEKANYPDEPSYDLFKPNDMGSRLYNPTNTSFSSFTQPSKKRRISTAHIQSCYDVSGTLAYDQFVSTCSDFLGSPINDTAVTQFAENILAILSSPITLDTSEIKRRLEQVLPTDKRYHHARGSKMTDKDCTMLCSLADSVLHNSATAPFLQTNLNIVVDQEDLNNSITGSSGEVHYIRHQQTSNNNENAVKLPTQLPNFVEPNLELGEDTTVAYDIDVTPYDSEVDEPIKINK